MSAKTRTHDEAMNAARDLIPGDDPALVALAAVLMNRGLLTAAELRDAIMRARAIEPPSPPPSQQG